MEAIILSSVDKVIQKSGEGDQNFAFASVTKLFASYAALIAVDRHLVDLDEEAGPATVRHLLGHTSGLPFEGAETVSEPGKRRIYSNEGFDVLGDHVAGKVGMSFQEWIEETVLEPLSLSSILIEGSPAHSGEGNAEDLAAFGRELLSPTLLSDELFKEATSTSFGELPGILPGYGRQKNNAWGLGFEIKAEKSPHWLGKSFSPSAFGHFGQAGSFLWVDPEAQLTGVYLGDESFGKKHVEMWPGLTDKMRAGEEF